MDCQYEGSYLNPSETLRKRAASLWEHSGSPRSWWRMRLTRFVQHFILLLWLSSGVSKGQVSGPACRRWLWQGDMSGRWLEVEKGFTWSERNNSVFNTSLQVHFWNHFEENLGVRGSSLSFILSQQYYVAVNSCKGCCVAFVEGERTQNWKQHDAVKAL